MNIRSSITANRHHCAVQVGLLSLLLVPWNSYAATTMKPTLYSQYSYDSNVYRLSNTEMTQVNQPYDSTLTQGASIDLNSNYQDYTLSAGADVSKLEYSYYNMLDHQNREYSLGFTGLLGNIWNYGIAWQQTNQLTEFTGETAYFDSKNLLRSNQSGLNIAWQFSADWRSQLELTWQSKNYSHTAYRAWNQDDATAKMSFEYNHAPGWLKPFVSTREERYPDRDVTPSGLLDNRNRLFALGNDMQITFAGHSTLYSTIAINAQKFINKPEHDHVWPQFHIKYRWDPSFKTSFSLSYTHHSHPVELQQANFVKTDGVTFATEWSPQNNITLAADLNRTLDDYDETTGIRRRDGSTAIDGSIRYQLLKYLQTSLRLRHQTKGSSNNAYAFDAEMMTITVSIQY